MTQSFVVRSVKGHRKKTYRPSMQSSLSFRYFPKETIRIRFFKDNICFSNNNNTTDRARAKTSTTGFFSMSNEIRTREKLPVLEQIDVTTCTNVFCSSRQDRIDQGILHMAFLLFIKEDFSLSFTDILLFGNWTLSIKQQILKKKKM